MKTKTSQAFTLVELLVVLTLIVIVVGGFGFGLIGAGAMGNQWLTEQGVIREIHSINPKAREILSIKRNVYRRSIIRVQLNDGSRQDYLLDSNILFNYTLTLKP